MSATQQVIVYRSQWEQARDQALLMDGGFVVIFAVILAFAIGAGVHYVIDINTSRQSFIRRNIMVISTVAAVGSLYLMHIAGMKGWL